jgi:hypothetical protein
MLMTTRSDRPSGAFHGIVDVTPLAVLCVGNLVRRNNAEIFDNDNFTEFRLREECVWGSRS